MDGTAASGAGPATPGLPHRSGGGGSTGVGVGGLSSERTSIYSATGIFAAAVNAAAAAAAAGGTSERNSFYAAPGAKQGLGAGDAASVRSGLLGHGRADSVTGSIGGIAGGGVAGTGTGTSPLASPREVSEAEAEMEKGVEEEDEGGVVKKTLN